MTGLGPGGSAITWARDQVARWTGHGPQASGGIVVPAPAATDDDTVPALLSPGWLADRADIRADIRAAVTRHQDQLGGWPVQEAATLERLAEATVVSGPWKAAADLFGTNRNGAQQ